MRALDKHHLFNSDPLGLRDCWWYLRSGWHNRRRVKG